MRTVLGTTRSVILDDCIPSYTVSISFDLEIVCSSHVLLTDLRWRSGKDSNRFVFYHQKLKTKGEDNSFKYIYIYISRFIRTFLLELLNCFSMDKRTFYEVNRDR